MPSTLLPLLLSVVIALTVNTKVFAQNDLPPVDQAASQPDFFTFRAQLIAALARRDSPFILAAVHPDIKNSFGGDDGIASFKKAWDIGKQDSRFWETLAYILALGGSFDPSGAFTAPYVYSQWPETLDAFQHIAVIGSGVRLRAAANTSSATVATLNFALVELATTATPTSPWTAVKTLDGKTGFIDKQYLRSPIDYRATFQKQNGRWQLVSLVAGD